MQPPKTGVAFLLSQVGARSAQEFARLIEPLKLSPADAGILRLLRQSPGISQQQLAETLGMHASRLVAIIDALESRKLVSRSQNPDDRRLYSLHLTARGEDTVTEIGNLSRTHNELLCSGLTSTETEQLVTLLQKVAAVQGLTPQVHPGYKELSRDSKQDQKSRIMTRPRSKSSKTQP